MSVPQTNLLRATRMKWWEPVLWLAAFAAPVLFPAQAPLINETAIWALFAISLDLVLGYAGIVSLGHAAFFGLGAYAAALFAKHVSPDPHLGLLAAMAASAVLGLVASFSILRGTDLTRLMVTLGLALILLELANKLDWLTGGTDGIQGLTIAPVLGQFEFGFDGRTASYFSLTLLLLFFLISRVIVNSPFGATLKSIRDNRLRAMAIGVPVHARLVAIYTVAAAIAGAAGAAFTLTSGYVSMEALSFDRSADVMLMVVIGGIGWLYGGIIGAVVFMAIRDVLSNITPQYWMFWIGLFLVVLVIVGRDRLLKPWTWFKGARA
ncbi:branched-chain amino acid ABC transporter permease [Ramlibacter sp. USB13]|uniref:Branched-chain amino acid ABC transporter permease n=1 Tax=Ramlibacter cellulosilyticus TaxID=2764187 RepID=A0A923MUX0_9BURK|nr:branched-chain amino acid ABC transporter permease [Ramlibacter cellulosilyticus]MBC5785723.1 branched-chain amino acid ABC transporter permease [Ramlibacter cellulosilyticus]